MAKHKHAIKLSSAVSQVARLHEYFGLWAIEATFGMGMWSRVRGMNLTEHVEETAVPHPASGSNWVQSVKLSAADDTKDNDTADDSVDESVDMAAVAAEGEESQDSEDTADDSIDAVDVEPDVDVALIHVCGTLMKQQSSLEASTSLVMLRKQLRDAAKDPRFVGILLKIDSPGGTVAGTYDVIAEVRAAALAKPCIAFIEDCGCSAAYAIACGAEEIYANHGTAVVGSIGTFIGLYDYSKWSENEGIQAKLYGTGPLKGAGFPGTKITPEQDDHFQKIVDDSQKYFSDAVAQGRKLSPAKVSKVATGGVFLAAEAEDEGLIDGIKTFDQVLRRMGELVAARRAETDTGRVQRSNPTKEDGMPKSTTTTTPATGTGTAAPASAAEVTTQASAPVAPGQKFIDAFGEQKGGLWFAQGKAFDECQSLYNADVRKQLADLTAANQTLATENTALKSRVAQLHGEAAPVSGGLEPDATAKSAVDIKDPAQRLGKGVARAAKAFALPK